MRSRRFGSRRLASAFLRCRHGVAAIEFAFAAPVLIVMTAGVYEFGSAFQAQSALNKLASQYASAWADCIDSTASPCSSELDQYLPNSNASYVMTNIAPQLNSSTNLNGLHIRMIWVTMSGTPGNLTAAQKYGREITFPSTYTSVTSVSASEQTLAQQSFTTAGQQGVIVTVDYVYKVLTLPNFLNVSSAGISMTNKVPQLTNN